MIKQVFMLAMLAMLPALCTKRAQAWSYNLEEFTISTDDIMSLYVSGDFVVWRDMMNMDLYGVRIYQILNDNCLDAVEIVENVLYNDNTIGATGC